jgi:hypothetical protein
MPARKRPRPVKEMRRLGREREYCVCWAYGWPITGYGPTWRSITLDVGPGHRVHSEGHLWEALRRPRVKCEDDSATGCYGQVRHAVHRCNYRRPCSSGDDNCTAL